jgi:hypothetical protein
VILLVTQEGNARCLYTEEWPFAELGQCHITRASHVEPCGLSWIADLTPVGMPTLGPFPTRSQALASEVQYLEEHMEQIGAPK